MGPPGFEPESMAPKATRMPNYPTGPGAGHARQPRDPGVPFGPLRKDEGPAVVARPMRVPPALVCALVLPGCLDAPAGAPGDDAPPWEPPPPDASLVVEVINTTFDIPRPGGADEVRFEVPAGHQELYIATPGETVLEGRVRVVATDPEGTEHVLLDGLYVDAPALRCAEPCTWRLEPVPGPWRIDATVDGSMRLPLAGRAQ